MTIRVLCSTLLLSAVVACGGPTPGTRGPAMTGQEDGATISTDGDGGNAEDANLPNAAAGSATITEQTVEGAELEGPMWVSAGISKLYKFVRTTLVTTHLEVAVSNFPSSCGGTEIGGKIYWFDFFHNPTNSDSTVTTPGVYTAWLPTLSGGTVPTDNRVVVTYTQRNEDGSASGFLAQSGTVTVTAVSEESVEAKFELVFEEGTMKGSFKAPKCDSWGWNASIPTTRTAE